MKAFLLLFITFFSSIISAQVLEDYAEIQATGFTTPQRGIKNISIINEDVVWALAYDASGNNDNVQEFTRTINGGDLWTPGTIDVGNPDLGIAMLHAFDENTAWVVTYPTAAGQIGGVFKTTDAGVTWNRQNTASFNATESFPNILHFWDENKGFCQGDPVDGYFEIYTTTDGGENWIRVPSANIPTPETGEYGETGNITFLEDGLWWMSNHYRIFRSYDFGNSFEALQSPLCDFSEPCEYKISFSDINNGYMIHQDGVSWKTEDGGETWSIEFPDTGLIFGDHIFALPNTDIVFSSGHQNAMGLSYSIDRGANWPVITNIVPITDIEMIMPPGTSDIYGWFGGFNTSATEGGIYKYIPPEYPCDYIKELKSNYTIYPNPVTNLLQIKAEKAITNISIFTVLGQEVGSYHPHTTSYDIDFSSFPKATYFLKISSGNLSEIKKVIK